MIRRGRITGLCLALFCLLAPAASAAPLGKAVLAKCEPATGEAVFEGRQSALRTTRMQMKFTLQVGQGRAKWRKIATEGFDTWINVPSGFAKYTYEKTVQGLLPGSGYRAIVTFRWRSGKKTVRTERSTSPVCRVPDTRPDLVVRDVAGDSAGYVAKVFNRGRSAAASFDVSFIVGGVPLGTARVVGLAPGASIDVFMPGSACTDGEALEAVVDPGSEVDESNEENGALTASC
jgi:CARDB